MIFSEGARYNRYESNTINKRINAPPILLSKQTKREKGNCYRSTVVKKESVFRKKVSENPEATVTFVRAAI